VLFAAWLLISACAQKPSSDSFDFYASNIDILQAKKIQKEIGVTQAQRAKMNVYAGTYTSRMTSYQKQLNKEKNTGPDKNKILGWRMDLKRGVFSELTAAQLKRLREITLQTQGVAALSDQRVAGRVGLSESQVTKIRDYLQSDDRELEKLQEMAIGPIVAKYRALKPKDDADRKRLSEQYNAEAKAAGTKYQPRVTALLFNTKNKIESVLTSGQKSKWNALLGSPFKG
jgi:hypothetical protein